MPLNKPNYGDLNWHTPLNTALDYLNAETVAVATSVTAVTASNALKAPLAGPTFTGTIKVLNATGPTAPQAGGGILYVEGGALKFKGSAGTITVIAPA